MFSQLPTLGYSTAFALTVNATGARYDPYWAYNFVVEIEGLLVGGFSEVSGLQSEVQVEEYHEGGVNTFTHKFTRQATFPPLVLQHGLTDIDTLWNWHYNVTRGIIQRKNGTIMLLDRQRIPAMWWDFRNAYPSKWTGPSFRANDSSQLAVESVELVHEGFLKSALSKMVSAAHGVSQLAGFTGF